MKQINRYEIISLAILSIILIVFSLYSVSYNSWIWNSGGTWKRVLGTFSGLAAFTGILATFYFWKRNSKSHIFAVINAVLFGCFALSVNLTGDFIVNILWIIPVLIFANIRSRKTKMTEHRLTSGFTLFFVMLWIVGFVFFFLVNPLINKL